MIELTYQPYDNPVTDFGWLLHATESVTHNGRLVWVTTTYRGSADTWDAAMFQAESFAKSIGGKIIARKPAVHEC